MAKFTETHRQALFTTIGVLTLAGVVAIFTLGSGESGRALPGFVPFFGEKEGTSASSQGNGPNTLNTSDTDGTSNSGQPETKDPSRTKNANGTGGDSKTGTGDGANPATRNDSPNNKSNPTDGTSADQSTWWKPTPGMSWQWQLTDLPVDLSVEADIYDIDLFDVDASVVTALHDKGRKVICYMSAGSYEDWRSDAGSFPESVLGKDNGWAGERWLDIRHRAAAPRKTTSGSAAAKESFKLRKSGVFMRAVLSPAHTGVKTIYGRPGMRQALQPSCRAFRVPAPNRKFPRAV